MNEVYSFIKSQVTYRTCLQSGYTKYGPLAQHACRLYSYTIGSRTTMQEIQPAAHIVAKHNIFPTLRHICHATSWCRWESIPGCLAWEARDCKHIDDEIASKLLYSRYISFLISIVLHLLKSLPFLTNSKTFLNFLFLYLLNLSSLATSTFTLILI